MISRCDVPRPPERSFASDNTAGVSPEVIDALNAVAAGSAMPYGSDDLTALAYQAFDDLFETNVATLFCWGGTGANVVGLASVLEPWQAVLSPDSAHIVVDECGAPARFTGATITPVPTSDGRLRIADLDPFLQWAHSEHHPQPRVVSVSQATETGQLYSVDQLGDIAEFAHSHNMLVHVDGARIANAIAATGASVNEMLVATGVDLMTFGLTKNGAMYGEAVVFIDPSLASNARFVRKQAGQLASKGRYIAAQALALLQDDLWLTNAAHANAMATTLAEQVSSISGIDIHGRPEVNAVFAQLPRSVIDDLQRWSFFWDWDTNENLVRWMTSFETTEADVERFVAGLRHFMSIQR